MEIDSSDFDRFGFDIEHALAAAAAAPGGVEVIRFGDMVLSRDQNDFEGEIEPKMVEEIFVRTGPILELQVHGRVIGTTAEHLFFVPGRGWRCAQELAVGDELTSHDRQHVRVESIRDTAEIKTVYNIRVADYHTYFVGNQEWGVFRMGP